MTKKQIYPIIETDPKGEKKIKLLSMIIPSLEFLESMEKKFHVKYPKTYKVFCSKYRNENILDKYPNLIKGNFITDVSTMRSINEKIGQEQWSDYETAIAGKIHKKDGNKLWGELLPIYYNDLVYGFNCLDDNDEAVYVWSTHCVVHSYRDIDEWIVDV